MRAVLDVNVYVSALLTPRGVPGRIVERFLRDASIEIVLSPDIAAEALRAFGYPKLKRYFVTGVVPAQWFDDIVARALVMAGDRPTTPYSRDPADDKYVAAALEGAAEYIVTGDDDLLALGACEGVAIVRPAVFLSILDRPPD